MMTSDHVSWVISVDGTQEGIAYEENGAWVVVDNAANEVYRAPSRNEALDGAERYFMPEPTTSVLRATLMADLFQSAKHLETLIEHSQGNYHRESEYIRALYHLQHVLDALPDEE
jgi:hypothetical protein